MLDLDLLINEIRRHGHEVGAVIPLPENAGEYEFEIDGKMLTLEETRLLLENDEAVTR